MPNQNLNFTIQQQQQNQWCWAATTVSIDAYYDPRTKHTQCEMANTIHGQTTCCVNGRTPACDRPATTGDVLNKIGRLRQQTEQAEPFAALDTEISAGRPVGARIVWKNNLGAHAVVIAGVGDNTNPVITVHDPGDQSSTTMRYDIFCNSYRGMGTWTRTWFTH